MWWLVACSSYEMKATSDIDQYYDTAAGEWEDDGTEENAPEEPSVDVDLNYRWWSLAADLHLDEEGLNKSKSLIAVNLYNQSLEYICTYRFVIQEGLPAEPSFDEGILWWRMLLEAAPEELQIETCPSLPIIPSTLQLGVGTLHPEILAVWNQIEWSDVVVPTEDLALSSYSSLDNGENIWVYGGATTERSTLEEMPNILYLRPAYHFSYEEDI